MQNFWRSCAYPTLKREANDTLAPSDNFFRAYLDRPELALVEESCVAERALHAALLDNPRASIDAAQLAAITDPDTRDNYRIWLRFRDRLLAAGTVETFYTQHFLERRIDIPPLLLDHLAQLILRGLLDGTDDPILVRSAELFFRRHADLIVQSPQGICAAVVRRTALNKSSGYADSGEAI